MSYIVSPLHLRYDIYIYTPTPYLCILYISHLFPLLIEVLSVSTLDDAAPLELFPGESAPFVPMGAVCGQGTFQVHLAVLGKNDQVQYSHWEM